MDDLISRQTAIDSVHANYDEILDFKSTGRTVADSIEDIINALPPAQKWIPCSERLPEVRQWVLCSCRAEIMDVLRLTNDGSWNKYYPYVDYRSDFVVAWMPLPKPYGAERKEE